MHVSDILRVKGHALYTVHPDQHLFDAVQTMTEHDIGSLVVIEYERVTGILTFREIFNALARNGGTLGEVRVRSAMDSDPLVCSPLTEIDEARRRAPNVAIQGNLDSTVLLGPVEKAKHKGEPFAYLLSTVLALRSDAAKVQELLVSAGNEPSLLAPSVAPSILASWFQGHATDSVHSHHGSRHEP